MLNWFRKMTGFILVSDFILVLILHVNIDRDMWKSHNYLISLLTPIQEYKMALSRYIYLIYSIQLELCDLLIVKNEDVVFWTIFLKC